jgi:hypothetical protein
MDNQQRTTTRLTALVMTSLCSALLLVACAGMSGGLPAGAGADEIKPTPALVTITATDANGTDIPGTLKEWYWDSQVIPATVGPDSAQIVYSEIVPGPITFHALRAPEKLNIRLARIDGSSGEVLSMTPIQPGSETMEWDPGALSTGTYLIMISATFPEGKIDFMYGVTVTAAATAEPTGEATQEP